MIFVALLQICMDSVEPACNCGGTCDGTEEVRIKVEESINIKKEIPEAITFPKIKSEHEVRLWCVCVCVSCCQLMLLCHLWPQKQTVKSRLTISCFVLCCGCRIPFEIWIAISREDNL